MAETMRRVVEGVTGNKMKAEEILNSKDDLSQHSCYKAAVNHYKHNCYNWHKTEVENFIHNRAISSNFGRFFMILRRK